MVMLMSRDIPALGLLSGDCVRHRLIRLRRSALYPVTGAYCPAIIFKIRDVCSRIGPLGETHMAPARLFRASAVCNAL